MIRIQDGDAVILVSAEAAIAAILSVMPDDVRSVALARMVEIQSHLIVPVLTRRAILRPGEGDGLIGGRG